MYILIFLRFFKLGFTAGIDLMELSQMANIDQDDIGRKAFAFKRVIEEYQQSISSVEDVKLIFKIYKKSLLEKF